ncbi:MAG: N-succinylarginine dihydrolase [Puniceicoccaceae bacterium]
MSQEPYVEINFDGLIGPTHHYGGLSNDNLASDLNRNRVSNPRRAALQGLAKMKALHDMGFPQAVLPPLLRPSLHALRAWGIPGTTPAELLQNASHLAPSLLSAACSASSMWTANAATVAPSCDTIDGRLHVRTANLQSKLHRSIEAWETCAYLQTLFGVGHVDPALPGGQAMADEGSANHTRLCPEASSMGLHVFVWGRDDADDALADGVTRRFTGRQTRLASETVARSLRLRPEQCLFLEQHANAIDAGVFHNDVIAVGNLNCYFCHERAYRKGNEALEALQLAYQQLTGDVLRCIVVSESDVSLERAVRTYLFNSQLVGTRDHMILIAPRECHEDAVVAAYLDQLCGQPDSPIREVRTFDLRESMRNGGGPACLRLRVVLSASELKAMGARVMMSDALYAELCSWVKHHYREKLTLDDLSDPTLLEQTHGAMHALSRILQMPLATDLQWRGS